MDRLVREHYRPIHDYGLIGDCESAALVSSDGSIDWWCPPRFDAPSVFAAVLDRLKGGFFRIHGGDRYVSSFAYVKDTNVLRTEFRGSASAFEVLDFMPIEHAASRGAGVRLIRLVRGLRGTAQVDLEFIPRFDYGRVLPRISTRGKCILAEGNGQALTLSSPVPLTVNAKAAVGSFEVQEGEEIAFTVGYQSYQGTRAPGLPSRETPDADTQAPLSLDQVRDALETTTNYWREWVGPHTYNGMYPEAVKRSALILKLLTYEPTGAVVAAPTCSLPEWIGGVRNWDYRYAWVRDAVFAVRALAEVGHEKEAVRFVDWMMRSADPDPKNLRVLYSVGGQECTPERVLEHLDGYRGSKPVRIGNAAEHQYQLDVFGEFLEGAYSCGLLDNVDPDGERWTYFRRLADFVADNWRTPDQGIWEVRSEPKNFVLSKVMAWAALDRAAQVASESKLPGDVERWRREAATIREEVLANGYDEKLGAFKQAYESPVLDASNLLLPILGFIDARDPRMMSTIDRTMEELTVNGLVYRYLDMDDGLPGGEATFAYCTFWLVEALALAGRVEEARKYFEDILARASPLGLFAEELHPHTGEHLGNYPQGFPHIGLIRSAVRLSRAAQRAQAGEDAASNEERPRATPANNR